jgi:hypothetical protein
MVRTFGRMPESRIPKPFSVDVNQRAADGREVRHKYGTVLMLKQSRPSA